MKNDKQRIWRLLNPKTNKGFNMEAKNLRHAQNRASITKNDGKYRASEYKYLG